MTPVLLIQRYLDTLVAHLPGTLDGDVESVHQARVATRRLREVLPYLHTRTWRRRDIDPDRIVKIVRRAARRLGRVRDLDVMSAMLDRAAERMPSMASVAALANDRLREQQRNERRAMVKALEKLELERLRKTIARWTGHGSGFSTVMRLLRQPAWVDDMWTRITERGAAVIRAVERAPGTYFPKRAHKTRIAVKKLRYAVEVAAETGTWQPPERLLGDLRKIQGTLGDIHDAQVVVEAIDDLLGDRADSREASILRELYQDDIARGYTRYIRRRDRIRAIADACARAAARHRSTARQTRALAAVSLATAPLFLSASQSSRSPRHTVVTSSG